QAEDGIRDGHVTGVQTCALPISDCVDSLFFCLEVFCHRRSMRSGQRRVTNQVEIWLCAAGDDGEACGVAVSAFCLDVAKDGFPLDRKSTRLNSSHVAISYAVFCL